MPVQKIAYNIKEAAEAVGVSVRTMSDWVHKPGFPARKIGGRQLIIADDLRDWMRAQPQK